jgi:hypothetical protein
MNAKLKNTETKPHLVFSDYVGSGSGKIIESDIQQMCKKLF